MRSVGDRKWAGVLCGIWCALAAFGCAQGYPGTEDSNASPLGVLPDPLADAGGAAGGPATEAPPEPVFSGEPCAIGETAACTCLDGVSQGMKTCAHDAASPTQGAFGECGGCIPPPMDTAGMGGAGAGTGGSMAAAGAGGAGSGGSGGDGGGSGGDGCDPAQCRQPSFGEACCTDRDECGTRLFLSCN